MTFSPTTTTSTPVPWQIRERSYAAKLGLTFLLALLVIVLLVSFFIVVGVGGILARGDSPDDVQANTIAVIIAGGFFLGSLAGAVAIFPQTRAITKITPSYAPVPPTQAGHPFDTRFQRSLWGRSMRGKGAVRFDPDGLKVSGYMETHALIQLAIVALLTFLPLLLFGIGLGVLPALIIAYYVGRRRIERTIPYSALSNLSVKGCQVTVRSSEAPTRITFAVAAADGERLYRELLPRFPTALGGWVG